MGASDLLLVGAHEPAVADDLLAADVEPVDAVRPGEDERAGRWAGSDKLECGIHVNAPLIKESND